MAHVRPRSQRDATRSSAVPRRSDQPKSSRKTERTKRRAPGRTVAPRIRWGTDSSMSDVNPLVPDTSISQLAPLEAHNAGAEHGQEPNSNPDEVRPRRR